MKEKVIMHTAPDTPKRLALLWIGLAAGSAAAAWGLVVLAHIVPGTATIRQLAYIATALGLSVLAAALTMQYRVQRARRDGWWDGFAAGDEPLADVVPLREGANVSHLLKRTDHSG